VYAANKRTFSKPDMADFRARYSGKEWNSKRIRRKFLVNEWQWRSVKHFKIGAAVTPETIIDEVFIAQPNPQLNPIHD